jgi:elongation factor P--(R)-beta-lysine ligase
MNPQLSKEILILRSKFLFALRSFFTEHEFLEVDTPKLKRVPGMEPYLTPFSVSDPSGKELGYLVTSPEYSLKQALSLGMSKIYEISQVYRSGERGALHSAEFLMLEFYISGIDEQALMDVCTELFLYLDQKFISIGFQDTPPQKKRIPDLFAELGISDSREDLLLYLQKTGRGRGLGKDAPYEDLFFLVFLNEIEPSFQGGIYYIYDYPAPLASLAKVEGDRAKRFEIYWNGVEIGNAFQECTSLDIMKERFIEEQEVRRSLSKEVFAMDENFLEALQRGIPESAGIAIGLDRLLMIYLGHRDLSCLSPYYNILGTKE